MDEEKRQWWNESSDCRKRLLIRLYIPENKNKDPALLTEEEIEMICSQVTIEYPELEDEDDNVEYEDNDEDDKIDTNYIFGKN